MSVAPFHYAFVPFKLGFPGGLNCKESSCSAGDWVRFLVGQIPWRRKWQPTPIFLPGKSHEQRCLAGYSPWGRKRVRHNLATKQQPFNLPSAGNNSKVRVLKIFTGTGP